MEETLRRWDFTNLQYSSPIPVQSAPQRFLCCSSLSSYLAAFTFLYSEMLHITPFAERPWLRFIYLWSHALISLARPSQTQHSYFLAQHNLGAADPTSTGANSAGCVRIRSCRSLRQNHERDSECNSISAIKVMDDSTPIHGLVGK